VEDAAAAQRLRQRTQLLDRFPARAKFVTGQALNSNVNFLQHVSSIG